MACGMEWMVSTSSKLYIEADLYNEGMRLSVRVLVDVTNLIRGCFGPCRGCSLHHGAHGR